MSIHSLFGVNPHEYPLPANECLTCRVRFCAGHQALLELAPRGDLRLRAGLEELGGEDLVSAAHTEERCGF